MTSHETISSTVSIAGECPDLQDRIAELGSLVKTAHLAHYKLVWVVGGSKAERSATLEAFSSTNSCPLLDVGKGLSQSLLDVLPSLRAASVEDCFSDLLGSADGVTVCLDHLEVLFEPSLKLNPTELVRGASRHRTLVASWPGGRDGDFLVFGPDGHPAHRRISGQQMECQFLQISP